MSFYFWFALGFLVLMVHDLIRGRVTSLWYLVSGQPLTTRRDNPRAYWSAIGWRTFAAATVMAMEWFHV